MFFTLKRSRIELFVDSPGYDSLGYDSLGYDSLVSQFFATKIRITQRILIKIENILTHWSVARTGSNDEKT